MTAMRSTTVIEEEASGVSPRKAHMKTRLQVGKIAPKVNVAFILSHATPNAKATPPPTPCKGDPAPTHIIR